MWQVCDAETGFSIKFREGMFNETQEVANPDKFPESVDLAIWGAKAMSAIGDYMAKEHPHLSSCNIRARRTSLWTLSHETWWITIISAFNSPTFDVGDFDLSDLLFFELDTFLNSSHENPANLADNEKSNLLGAISLLDEDEISEVFAIIHIFWHEYHDARIDTQTWARDLLWWPAWANTVIDKLEAKEDGNNK